jgi:signal peptidase
MNDGAARDAGTGDERRGRPRRSRFGLGGYPVAPGDSVSLFYKGPSMNPLLTTPDVLYVKPYRETEVCRGDVVVFPSPDGGCKVVHRVVSVNGKEIRTKGDNNGHADSWVLKRESIIGRVDWIERGDTKIRIYGGLVGRAQAIALKLVRALGSSVCHLLRPLYAYLAQNRALKRWFASRAAMRIISLNRPEGEELQLLVGQRVIGRRPAGRRYWLIRKPFMLFVDEKSLPSGD